MVVGLTEAAKLAGKPRSTLVRHVKAGKLATVQDSSGKLRFDTAELSRCYNLQPERTVEPATSGNGFSQPNGNDPVLQVLQRVRGRLGGWLGV